METNWLVANIPNKRLLDPVIPKVIGSSLQQPLPQPITIYHTSLTRDKLPVFPVLELANTGLETTVSSSNAAQNNVALMPKFWGDLADEEIDHSLEKDLTSN